MKLLGITTGLTLKWDSQIEEIAKNLNKVVYCLQNLKNCVSVGIIKIYSFAFRSHFLYGLLIYGHSAHTKRFLEIQRLLHNPISALFAPISYFENGNILDTQTKYVKIEYNYYSNKICNILPKEVKQHTLTSFGKVVRKYLTSKALSSYE